MTAVESMPGGYTDLRLLIDINPPKYDFEAIPVQERVEFMKYKVNTFQAEADLKAAEAEKALLAAESSARQADSRAPIAPRVVIRRKDSAEKHRRLAEDAEAEKQVAQQQAYDAAIHALELQSVQSQTQSFIRSDTEGLNSEDNSTDVSRRPSRQEAKKDKKKSKTSGRANQYKADQEAETAGAEEVESDGEESRKVKTAAGRVGASRGAPQRGMSGLATLPEGEIAEDIALDDEEAWEAVPMEHVPGRFTQYRAMSRKRIAELDTEIDTTVTKTARKIQTLKAQFHEHRDKWQAEREILLSHMEQAQDLQDKAEKEADQALDHLEDFIVEQEKLEKHEESQRMELMKEEMTLDEKHQQKSAELLAAEEALNKELEEQQQDQQPPPVEPVERDDGGDIADEELDKALLQQTDDAKELRKQHSIQQSTPSPALVITPTPALPRSRAASHASNNTKSLTPAQNGNSRPSSSIIDDPSPVLANQSIVSPALTNQKVAHDPMGLNSNQTSVAMSRQSTMKSSTKSRTNHLLDSKPSTAKLEQSSRATSSMSRSSLREHQRSVLSQMKSSVAGRRSATPTAKSAKSFRSSTLSDAVLDENGDIPFPDDITAEEREVLSMHDVATSPMSMKTPSAQPRRTSAVRPHSDLSKHLEVTGQFVKDMTQVDAPLDLVAPTPDPQLASLRDDRITECAEDEDLFYWKGISMSEHPVVQEYLRAYNNVLDFKNRLSQVLMDKEMVSAAQVLGDIEPVPFDKDDVVQPQIEEMNTNLMTILEESVALFSSVLSIDRDYNVSSMSVSQSMSRELTQNPERMTSTAPQTADKSPVEVMSRVSHHPGSAKSKLSDPALREMDEKYQIIQNQLQLETMEREKQLQHNTMIIMEMQETINALRQQLTAMEEAQPQVIPDTEPIMFTRLDSERNAKIMKRAVNDRKLDPEHYEDAMSTMDQYISLPAQRLASLVKKYVHHCKMKEIEVNVQKSKSLNDNVFNILDKMETLQNERAVKWADRMDAISMERIRLANMLMSTLDSIEQESGIFLIKPMYSYKPSYPTGDRFKKSSRTNKPTSPSQTSYVHQQAVSHTPQLANTPDQKHKPNALPPIDDQATQTAYNTEDGITGKSNVLGGDTKGTWSMYSSQVAPMSSDLPVNASHINTPRILELDINRMHIGQNHISSRIVSNSLPEDRVVTGPHMSTRSYLTVTRPSGQTVSHNQSRGATAEARSSVPPTTPLRELETPSSSVPGQTGGSRPVTGQVSRAGSITGSRHGSTTPTLPPITADRKSRKSATIELPLPPHSPPGSSIRQSPPLMDALSQTSQQ